jgi:hypothetical protein
LFHFGRDIDRVASCLHSYNLSRDGTFL